MRRREFITLLGGAAAAWPLAARAQQATKMPRIGILSPGRSELHDPTNNMVNALLQGLHELGYTEGQNLAVERLYADWSLDRLPELAAELVRRKPDIIVAISTTAARPAKQATDTIPIVAVGVADPVADELVASLARPSGNVTGTTFLGPELVAKRLQLLREVVPGLSRVAALGHPHAYSERTMAGVLKEVEAAARTLGLQLQLVPADSPDDIAGAFAADDPRARRGSHCLAQPDVVYPIRTHREHDRKQPTAGNGRSQGVRGCRRPDVLWSEPARPCQADRQVCGQNPERGKASRVTRGAADQIRAGDQS